ncbi:MAG TPA: hypothetical protein VJ841_03200 [Candidatus Saccharimonadales bacterium]|nr:hypothetical protein [Candidatus Saccharimonadales bacterium]
MRAPLPLVQWDAMACETACTAQILYMLGKIERNQVLSLDRRIGRRAYQPDMQYGNMRLLLEHGLHLKAKSPIRPEEIVGPDGLKKVEAFWRQMGRTEVEIEFDLPYFFSDLVEAARIQIQIRRQFKGQIDIQEGYATQVDFKRMLLDGCFVFCSELAVGGTVHTLLAIPEDSRHCTLYDPSNGSLVCKPIERIKVASYGSGYYQV